MRVVAGEQCRLDECSGRGAGRDCGASVALTHSRLLIGSLVKFILFHGRRSATYAGNIHKYT